MSEFAVCLSVCLWLGWHAYCLRCDYVFTPALCLKYNKVPEQYLPLVDTFHVVGMLHLNKNWPFVRFPPAVVKCEAGQKDSPGCVSVYLVQNCWEQEFRQVHSVIHLSLCTMPSSLDLSNTRVVGKRLTQLITWKLEASLLIGCLIFVV